MAIDSIFLTWIFKTLSKTLQQRLVVENPTTKKEAWGILALIFNDNKRSRSIALKAELSSMKLGDLSIDAYFRKIEPVATILSSLGSPISNDDVVSISLDGLPDKYQHVSDIIIHQDPFPDLKTFRSMLTMAEMHLKSWAQHTYDSTLSTLMVLLANFGANARRSTPSTEKSNSTHNPKVTSSLSLKPTDILTLQGLLAKLGANEKSTSPQPNDNTIVQIHTMNNPLALHTAHTSPSNKSVLNHGPPGFYGPPAQHGSNYHQLGQLSVLVYTSHFLGQETILANAFSTMTLHDHALGNWNMDTGASSHINDSISSLSDVFDLYIYPSVSVGDGSSIPVTNFGHSILPTTHIYLNNILITLNTVRNLISVHQFVRDNSCTVEFDAFGFSVKDFLTRRVLFRCDSTGDLYPVTQPSNIPHAFLTNGTLSRYKARLVANGSTHVEGIDVDETFSPVVKIRYHSDAETVYMHQPPSFWDFAHHDYVCLLQRHGIDTAYLLLYVDDIVLAVSFEILDVFSQRKYATEILERAHMVGCNSSRTPVDTESKLGDNVQQVCLYMHDHREPHFSALRRILRYVHGTLDYGLQLFASSNTSLVTYSNADWAGCPTTRRSTSGYCVFFGNNLLSWSSKRQPTLSCSSAEAEYRGVVNAVAETCWLRNLLRELHTPLSFATLVYCDNVSAVY
ncbi:ribonuclease H-like domain-containing protein [Tanacetum coccineum]|uniref:Ribonuclease H-like domain-containing protein n=1 Tax=Tanacetum coccineum TaxID=301880 RepID=A0ABQ5ESL9_9ASTR